MEEFIHIDDENNKVFSQEILDDENEVLETMQTTPENAEDESDHTSSLPKLEHHFRNQQKIVSISVGLSNVRKILEIEDQLFCPEVQAQVGDEYGELKNSFEPFQRKLRRVIVEAKRKRGCSKHQLTIRDMFKK